MPRLLTRRLGLAAALLLLAGCTHLSAGQQAHLDDWQHFASRVTAHYGVSEVTFLVGDQEGPGGGAMRPGGVMTFKVAMLEPLPPGQSRDFLLAHELAHWVLGHAYRRAPDEATTSMWDAQQERREMDANAEAVKILVIGRHWTERRAFFHAHAYLWSYRRGVAARQIGVPAGHPLDPCVEINDLIRRYPTYHDIAESCPSWPEPRWAEHAARHDALPREATAPDVR